MQRDVAQVGERLAERLLEPLVDLYHVHVRGARREARRQHAEAAADLEHDVVRTEVGEALDHPEDVGVDEKVLTELS